MKKAYIPPRQKTWKISLTRNVMLQNSVHISNQTVSGGWAKEDDDFWDDKAY